MQLPEISIRRPVFATVLSLLIVLLGWVSFNRLTVREYPKIDNPVVTVETKYVGASSTVVESQVTKVLEDSLSGIEGVDIITSISRQEQSQITVKFVLSRDPDSAAARGGLVADDLVIAVGGRTVTTRVDVEQALGGLAEGDPVKLTVIRRGALVELNLGPRPRGGRP